MAINSTENGIDAYDARFPADVQAILQKIRIIARNSAPDADRPAGSWTVSLDQKPVMAR